jgi:hypothetical protein
VDRKPGRLTLTVGVVYEIALLAVQRLQPDFRIASAALVLGQRHHPGEVGLREPPTC